MPKKKQKRLPKKLSSLLKSKPLKKITEKKGKLKCMSKKEVEEARFRVCCLNPYMDGALRLESSFEKLCGHGYGMTIKEINENLIWKGKPYIRIPYCKYCYSENTVGVFDDTPQLLGWAVFPPDSEQPYFRLEKLSKEAYERVRKNLREHGQI